ncbi:MAG: hypothetical protein KDJ16_16130 [Hyphomicrobiales bacterium]|nr:hypothetical protein [Hyphomicrobiales bacterium]
MSQAFALTDRAPAVKIRSVQSRRDLKRFIRLPRRVYTGMAGYHPRLDYEQRQILDPRRGPFFRHGKARYWLAYHNGRAVGRISAQLDELAPQVDGEMIGFFGCLDSIDDQTTVEALLGTAESWLREHGVSVVRGPFTLSINGESGLLLAGFAANPMVLMGWSPPYLSAHLEKSGYRLARSLYSYRLATGGHWDSAQTASLRKRLLAGRVRVRGLDMRHLRREQEIFRNLFNDAWADNWGFAPMARSEMEKLFGSMRPILHHDFGTIFETDDKPVAFALVLPNLAEIVGKFDGRLLPFNWMRLAWWVLRRRYTSGRIILFGVAGDFRGSVLGAAVPLVMIDELVRRSRRWRFVELEMGWVLEDNRQVRTLIEKFGGVIDKTYGVFEKRLGNNRLVRAEG